MKNCKNCGTEIRDEDRICYRCGAEYVEEAPESVTEGESGLTEETSVPKYKLKWHILFIAILMIAGAARVFFSVQAITGWNLYTINGVDITVLVNMFYPGIKELNIVYGVIGLLTAILMYCVGFWLIKFRRKALKWMGIMFLGWIAVRVLYIGAVSLVSKRNSFENSTIISTIVGYMILGVINWVYYSRRKELFVK